MKVMKKNSKESKREKSKSTAKLKAGSGHYREAVCSIGYKVPGVRSAKKLKGNDQEIRNRVGGKAAGLIEMSKLGVAVPPAFNLSTSLCQVYLMRGKLPEAVLITVKKAIQGLEQNLKKTFGGDENPLLVSVRSGARVSMPGMMDTILNLGLNTKITESLATKNPEQARFWWDCYRRFIQMFSEVVLGVDGEEMEAALRRRKNQEGASSDAGLSAGALQELSMEFLHIVEAQKQKFPQDSWEQLVQAMEAVFRSWQSERAKHYREIHKISDDWGTSLTVQSMVFGNKNNQSGTGVVFTRDPSTGEKKLYGEYLMNAQGEDVVAGIRTPHPISDLQKSDAKAYRTLVKNLKTLETHFKEVQDVEFTIEDQNLFILQTRHAKRTAAASLEFAVQFVKEKRWTKSEALQKITFDQVSQLLHPTLKATDEKPFCKGLPASPGAVTGLAVFSPEAAVHLTRAEQKVILIRRETSPEDIMGMSVAEGILTSTGGMTSHAAVVGRGMGKACIVGCSDLQVDEQNKCATFNGNELKEGDLITLNGSTGKVYLGELPTEAVSWGKSARIFFDWADKNSKMPVYANADTPDQALTARDLGATGIGLCRTEHMFFEASRLRHLRKMILIEDMKACEASLDAALPFQRDDFMGIFTAMNGYPVSVRLLDPPLHEFLPALDGQDEIQTLAKEIGIDPLRLTHRIRQMHETNPMLGHRGCRLGVTFPGIYKMQVKALAQALVRTIKKGNKSILKIMIPLVMDPGELQLLLTSLQKVFLETLGAESNGDKGLLRKCQKAVKWGTMIELPRAAILAGPISKDLDFISFGTNDLTQTTLGISRDDAAKFVPIYREKGLMKNDPFETLDQAGVGFLIEHAVREARRANKKIEVGVCGEHGGDPESIEFFKRQKFNSVSCSPFRVPMARLALGRPTPKFRRSKKT